MSSIVQDIPVTVIEVMTLDHPEQPVFLFVKIVIFAITLGLFLPISILFIECIAAFLPSRRVEWDSMVFRPKINILVPAHNEATGISATLETLLPQLTAQDLLLVIADNCNDETAVVARMSGATVIERQDTERRGKGYALDYGLQFIKTNPPEVVVVVDADCIVEQGTIDKIARQSFATARPVQAIYLMKQPDNPDLKDLFSTLAITVKNLVRPSGLDRLGLPCLLTGSGMAFPWSVISKVSLAGSKTADDMQLALDLAIAGHAPMCSQEAQVTGRLMKQHAAKSQRTRWEHGHLETLLTQVPHLLKACIEQKRFELFTLALELCVPPLSLLVMVWAGAVGVALLTGVIGSAWILTVLLTIEWLLISISIVGAWVKFSSAKLPVLMLLAVPLYVLWKIPLYLNFLIKPQTKWIRTERDIDNVSDVKATLFKSEF